MNLKALNLSIIIFLAYSIAFILDTDSLFGYSHNQLELLQTLTLKNNISKQIFLLLLPSISVGFFSLAILFSSRLLLLEKIFQSYSLEIESCKIFAKIAQGLFVYYLAFYLTNIPSQTLNWFSTLLFLGIFGYLLLQPTILKILNIKISAGWHNSNGSLSIQLILVIIQLTLFNYKYNLLSYLNLLNFIYCIIALVGIYNRQIKLKLYSSSFPYRVIDKKLIKKGIEVLMEITLEPIYQVAIIKNYQPGKFVFVKLPIHNQRISWSEKQPKESSSINPFLISKLTCQQLPLFILEESNNNLKLVIQKTGNLASFFFTFIKPKTKLMLEGCYGQFNLDNLVPKTKIKKNIIMFSQDVGMVVFLAYLFDYLAKKKTTHKFNNLNLIHFSSHNFYKDSIVNLQKKIHNLSSNYISVQADTDQTTRLEEVISKLELVSCSGSYFFICGRKRFIKTIRKALLTRSVSRKNIFFEQLG